MFSSRKVIVAAILLVFSSVFFVSCNLVGVRTPAVSNDEDKSIVLIGNIPGVYLNKDKAKFFLGFVEISSKRVITAMGALAADDVTDFVAQQKKEKTVVTLLQPNSKTYDAIYPGLLNLHNHTKQNILPTWPAAKGQFQNRFEWRDWGIYKKSVSQNMNPWIGYGVAMNCAAFRWSRRWRRMSSRCSVRSQCCGSSSGQTRQDESRWRT